MEEQIEAENKLLRELLENRDKTIELLIKQQDDALKREQEKNETTIETIKDITKSYNKKECIRAVVALSRLFALIIIIGLS